MNLVLAIACDAATVSPHGKLDVQGIYNELSAPDFPAAQERLTVVLVLEWSARDAGEQPIRADLIGPDGALVVTIQGHTEVELGPDNELFLDQSSGCVDNGDDLIADATYSVEWQELTTSLDGTLDAPPVDMGAHYVP